MKTKDFLYFVQGYLEGIKTSEKISLRQVFKLKMIIEHFKERKNSFEDDFKSDDNYQDNYNTDENNNDKYYNEDLDNDQQNPDYYG